jgi:hypothetical protein
MSLSILGAYLRNLILGTRVTSGDARGQAKQKQSVILLFEGLPQEPDFENQGDLWRGQRSGKAETERWVSFSRLRRSSAQQPFL